MEFSEKLLLAIIAISFVFLVLALAISPAPEKKPEVPEPNKTTPEINNPAPPTPDVWSLLTMTNVEDQCLKQARDYAKKQGFPAFAILGCSCNGSELAGVKSYNCTIDSLDGQYEVDANCVKSEERCIFNSVAGKVYYSFEELSEMLLE